LAADYYIYCETSRIRAEERLIVIDARAVEIESRLNGIAIEKACMKVQTRAWSARKRKVQARMDYLVDYPCQDPLSPEFGAQISSAERLRMAIEKAQIEGLEIRTQKALGELALLSAQTVGKLKKNDAQLRGMIEDLLSRSEEEAKTRKEVEREQTRKLTAAEKVAAAIARAQDEGRVVKTQKALAELAGVHPSTLGKIKKGDVVLRQTIEALIAAGKSVGRGNGASSSPAATKSEALSEAVNKLHGRDIYILQMEYEFSMGFLEAFKKRLMADWDCTEADAVYNTGELAKLMMAGGLGSFKPDLVGGEYEVLAEHWGEKEAKERLHVMGVFYSGAIKGQGPIQARGPVTGAQLVEIARSMLPEVTTYKDIELNMNGVAKTDVTIRRNPYSELEEFWMDCPAVFHEAYCGNSDDDFRAVQSLLYRKVLLQFVLEHSVPLRKLAFSTSEVNTTLAIPAVINDDFKNSL